MTRVIIGVGLLVAAAVAVYPPQYGVFPDGTYASSFRRPLWAEPPSVGEDRIDFGRLAVELGAVAALTAGAALLAAHAVKRPQEGGLRG